MEKHISTSGTNSANPNAAQAAGPRSTRTVADRRSEVVPVNVAAGLRIFDGVDPLTLAEVAPALKLRLFMEGDVVLRQGEQADHLLILVSGQVRISASNPTSVKDVNLAVRGEGEVVGEQAFIGETRRTATATALVTSKVLQLPFTAAERLIRDPAFAMNLLRALSRKLSQATRDRAFRYRVEARLFGEFRAHVSDSALQELLASGEDFGKARREHAVILFSDIRSFTELSAEIDPLETAEELTKYFNHVVALVHRHKGIVDKFIGDAIMAVWTGALSGTGSPADQALACACEMARTAENFLLGGTPISIGIGLNSGEVFLGNIGGEGKRQFTVVGRAVNLASRCEAESKELKVPIVIGDDLYSELAGRWREQLTRHEREIRGAGFCTVYGLNPPTVSEGSRGGKP